MAWVQVGTHKINTALVCYVEQEGDTVRVYFNGQWEGNPLDLHFDEAKCFWRHIKSEDVMMAKDKGSAAVLPKVGSSGGTPAYGFNDDHAEKTSDKPKPAHAPSSSSHSHKPSAGGDHKRH